MSEWRSVKLSDLFKVKHGYAFKGEFFCDQPTKELLVTPGNFATGGGFQNKKQKFYNGDVPEDYVLSPGDLIVTMTDLSKQSDTLGYGAIVPTDENTWLHNQRVGLVELKNKNSANKLYLNYFFRGRVYRAWIIGSATGTTVKHTSPTKIELFEALLPPLPEQKAIAHILGTLDDKIELNRKMNETLEAMAQALFKSWFVDFDPVIDNALASGGDIPEDLQAKATSRKAVKASGSCKPLPEDIQKLFPAAFEYNEEFGKWIPEGWEVKNIKDTGTIITGKTPPSKNPEHFGNNCLFVTPTDFKNYFKLITNSSRKISEEGIAANVHRILPKDSVVVTCIGSDMGKVAINKFPCMTNQQINAVIPNDEKMSAEYLYFFFKENYELLQNLARGGSTMLILNKTDFGSIPILIPPTELLFVLNSYFKEYDKKILCDINQTHCLEKQRDLLLSQLISGKTRLPKSFIEQFETKTAVVS